MPHHSFLPLALLVFVAPSIAFVCKQPFGLTKERHALSTCAEELPHTAETLINVGEFQLEEREDQDTEITQVWLNNDKTITLGVTDGPPVQGYSGSWSILETATEDDQPFRMRLDRTYEAGTHTGDSNVGEFDYHVKREFWGNIGMVGDSVSVYGDVHGMDESARVDCQVGYFSLIDSSTEQ